jgi:hypothetical protein
MAIIGGVQRAQNAIEIVERVQLRHPLGADKLDVEAQRASHRQRVPQPVHLILGIGQPERPAAMPRHGLPGLGLQRAGIEADVVIHAFAEREGRGRMRDLPGCVPRRPAGQFRLFQKNRVRAPTLMGEVIGEADPHDTAADNDDAGVGGNSDMARLTWFKCFL